MSRPLPSSRFERVTRALASEDRLAIFDAMAFGAESPVQAARVVGMPIANVSYHVRGLREAGMIERQGYRPARGAVENLYEVTALGRRVRDAARLVQAAVEGA